MSERQINELVEFVTISYSGLAIEIDGYREFGSDTVLLYHNGELLGTLSNSHPQYSEIMSELRGHRIPEED